MPGTVRRPQAAELALLTEPGEPWVLLSLSSTLQGQVAALPAMLAAMESVSARVLLTLGDIIPLDAVVAPDNVVVRAFVPHEWSAAHVRGRLPRRTQHHHFGADGRHPPCLHPSGSRSTPERGSRRGMWRSGDRSHPTRRRPCSRPRSTQYCMTASHELRPAGLRTRSCHSVAERRRLSTSSGSRCQPHPCRRHENDPPALRPMGHQGSVPGVTG